MHQGLTTKILICLVLLLSTQANSQLNSNEAIDTIEDIQIQDDSNKKPIENPNKPQYDEEFGEQQEAPKPKEVPAEENNIAEPEPETESVEPEEEVKKETVQRKDLENEGKDSYQEELEKNANQNKLERKELSPDEANSFEVDPTPKPAPVEPVVESPLTPEEEILEEAKAIPESPQAPTEELLEEEISSEEMPADPIVEEEGAPIQYAPEPAGPVIVYENEKKMSDEELKQLEETTAVEIESDPYTDADIKTQATDYLKPYKDRRSSWSSEIELGSSMFVPVNYLTDINPTEDFETFYETASVPLSGIGLEIKKNFSFASIAVGVSASYYSATQDDATFTLIVPSVEATLYLDMLWDEPYLVPYGTIGYSYMMYDENNSFTEVQYKGETDNFFAAVGVLLQLDWLDPDGDASAYQDMGIENTFFFVEGKTFLDQGIMRAEDDADFSTPLQLAAGIKLEF